MVKLKDIAKETGLTVSTVSKALNHSPEISEATSRLVRQTAEQMGYRAKTPVKASTKTIGIILPEVRSHYYAELLQSLDSKITRRGYTTLITLTEGYAGNAQPAIERICKYNLDGLLISCNSSFSDESSQYLLDSGIPTVLLDVTTSLNYPLDSIRIREGRGVSQALEYLLSLGHRKIGYLGEYSSDIRYQKFCALMEEHGLAVDPAFVRCGAERFERGGYLRAMELFEQKELPTAILVGYDQMAYGVLRACRERGIRVPEDLSIVGFDDIVMDDYFPVALTSVSYPMEQMGTVAVQILMDAIENPKNHVVQNVALQTKLAVRSSACPPASSE